MIGGWSGGALGLRLTETGLGSGDRGLTGGDPRLCPLQAAVGVGESGERLGESALGLAFFFQQTCLGFGSGLEEVKDAVCGGCFIIGWHFVSFGW